MENWKMIAIPSKLVGKRYGMAVRIKTPESYGDYSLFIPIKCISISYNMAVIKYTDTFIFTLNHLEYDTDGKKNG